MSEDEVLKTTIKELLLQLFSDSKEKSINDGMIVTLEEIRGQLHTIAQLSKDRTLTLILMDITTLEQLIMLERDNFIKEYVKNEFKDELKRDLEIETFDILSEMVDSLEVSEFISIEGDYVATEEILNKFASVFSYYPQEVSENLFLILVNRMQTGFINTVHTKFPELMEPFFIDVLSAIKEGSLENVLELFGEEKLRWYSRVFDYP